MVPSVRDIVNNASDDCVVGFSAKRYVPLQRCYIALRCGVLVALTLILKDQRHVVIREWHCEIY